jgi:tetratricopeptide (TPR) repeat protein
MSALDSRAGVPQRPSRQRGATGRAGAAVQRAALIGAVLWLHAGTRALAQEQGPDAADALFDQGRKLMRLELYGEACPKFAESHRIDPTLGTLLNLAYCWKQLGKTASAWSAYREASLLAVWQQQAQREAFARQEADALEPQLAKLRVAVTVPEPDLVVRRDGVVVPPEAWGEPIAIDPGAYRIEALCPGRRAFATTVIVPPAGAIEVVVPALEPLPAGEAAGATATERNTAPRLHRLPPPRAAAAAAHAQARASRTTEPVDAGLSTWSIAGLGVGAAGLTAFGLAGYFALRTNARDEDARAICADAAAPCSAGEVASHARLVESARESRTAAFVGLGIGSACALGALALLLTGRSLDSTSAPAPARPSAAIALELGATRVVARGRW